MSVTLFILLQLATAFGALVQSTIGFAFSLFIIAIFGVFEILPIEQSSIVIMLLALPNVILSLRGNTNIIKQIKVAPFIWFAPMGTIIGLYLLYTLIHYPLGYKILYFILGLFIILATLILVFKPKKQNRKSPLWKFYFYSLLAGLGSGLFALASPPIVYLLYQQPWSINGIRHMLLTMFLLTITTRVSMTAWQGKITMELLTLFVSLLPTVIIFTFIGRKYRNRINPSHVRTITMIMLGTSGINILYKAYLL